MPGYETVRGLGRHYFLGQAVLHRHGLWEERHLSECMFVEH